MRHEHEWGTHGECVYSGCYGVKDPMADVRSLAVEMDRRWPDMHTEQFGPIAAGLVTRIPEFSSGEDAHNVATDRQQRADETRNSDIREVVAGLRSGEMTRDEAIARMLLTLWTQAHLLGLQGPTLLVGVPTP